MKDKLKAVVEAVIDDKNVVGTFALTYESELFLIGPRSGALRSFIYERRVTLPYNGDASRDAIMSRIRREALANETATESATPLVQLSDEERERFSAEAWGIARERPQLNDTFLLFAAPPHENGVADEPELLGAFSNPIKALDYANERAVYHEFDPQTGKPHRLTLHELESRGQLVKLKRDVPLVAATPERGAFRCSMTNGGHLTRISFDEHFNPALDSETTPTPVGSYVIDGVRHGCIVEGRDFVRNAYLVFVSATGVTAEAARINALARARKYNEEHNLHFSL